PLDTIIKKDTLSKYLITKDISAKTKIYPHSHIVIKTENLKFDFKKSNSCFLLRKDSTIWAKAILNDTIKNNTYARYPDGSPEMVNIGISSPGLFNPDWQWVWSTNQASNTEFKKVVIPIRNPKFLKKGFRFRFRNYASLGSDQTHARNQDYWHIDNVLLNTNSAVSDYPDVTFNSAKFTFYSDYNTIPYRHLASIKEDNINHYTDTYISNYNPEPQKISFKFSIDRSYRSTGKTNITLFDQDRPTSSQVPQNINIKSRFNFYDYLMDDVQKGGEYQEYVLKFYYSHNDNPIHTPFRYNDTITYRQKFYNYYAYDDGTAEAGYGIRGSEFAQVAYSFTNLQKDTLKAIQMYFNHTLYPTPQLFYLCVWKANKNGLPGEMIVKQLGEKIKFGEKVNSYATYYILPESILSEKYKPLVLEGTYFIGWEQPKDLLMNVGIDMNNTPKKKLYYKTDFEWNSSLVTGALMMRPVFGVEPPVNIRKNTENNIDITVYPNPSSRYISLRMNEFCKENFEELQIINLAGEVIEKSNNYFHVPISHISEGLYIIKVILKDTNTIQLRFIKQSAN
ncbi:MAG: T9SS type A sorting domain-containing protein, partial [Bacteroidales bacterium]